MLALLLIPAYALADRFTGGGWPSLDAKLPGRSLAWAAAACIGAGYLVGGWPLAVMGLAWGVYRSLAWDIGGTTTPRGGQIPAAFARHALPAIIPAALWANHVPGGDWRLLVFACLAYALVATVLAVAYAREVDDLIATGRPDNGEFNAKVELIRGAAYGAALAAWAVVAA